MSSSQEPDGSPPPEGGDPPPFRLTRRAALSGAALLGAGAALDEAIARPAARAAEPGARVAFHGSHQAGITTPQQAHLQFAAFDLTTHSRAGLRALLERWSEAAAALTSGRAVGSDDPGEAVGLPASRLTLTFGLGPGLFARGRLGLAARRPALLEPLPPFPGEDIDPAQSGGDLSIQACAEDPQVAFHAVHVIAQLAEPAARLRWVQLGFRAGGGAGQSPRNLLGFRDGTQNLRPSDAAALERFVWVSGRDDPRWLAGGTFLVVRRIEFDISAWDAVSREQQEQTIGRRKLSGAPLSGGAHEHDPVDLSRRGASGAPLIPAHAHIRLAAPESNGGTRILRRSYSFTRGLVPGGAAKPLATLDGGLFFIAFVRDPRRFIALQQRLAVGDALNSFTVHTGTAIFACPPGAPPGGFVGEGLFA